MQLNPDEKRKLLEIARRSVETGVLGKPIPAFQVTEAVLLAPAGVFVTLYRGRELRGCIGYTDPGSPLWQAAAEAARSAALNDSRFPAVDPLELSSLRIEISVLTPSLDIPGPEGFEVGRQGIIITLQGKRGVFLPKVATDQGWDRETTLRQLCLKAGLPAEAFRKPEMRFRVFESAVFGEKEGGS